MDNGERIAIVGIGLRYPDASGPPSFWENVLAGRRAFRRLPDERMNSADYYSDNPAEPDRFNASKAAVLRDYEFDRVAHRIAGSTFRTTDMTHWLALDVATEALADAGFADGAGLPHARTGVVLGNTLTGEFTRANNLRLRWPYVRRTVAAALTDRGWDTADTASFLADLERQYKSPFPEIDEDSLAGGLSNTIAGRICNVHDLGGGGFTVDGACSSSLLSVCAAAARLVDGALDVALAGGVDLSIDPFEMVGFAKTGALATEDMRVYDRRSNGFWPGEGCGVLVLMRESDAVRAGKRIYASIGGWGISSDGKGGITRPVARGHVAAIEQAYARTGWTPADVAYFEGHGTGTAVGDETEIDAISTARRRADASAPPAALSTVKGNIGHTKAAAGVAGLIKAALSLHHQIVPPATGHHDPHPRLVADDALLHVPSTAAPWPSGAPRRAGVSAMGFGGINSHVALCEAPGVQRRTTVDARTAGLVAGRQDAELLLFDAPDPRTLADRVAALVPVVAKLAFAELADLAGTLTNELTGGPVRLAIVARDPAEAVRKLGHATELLAAAADHGDGPSPTPSVVDRDGISLCAATTPPRIGFLFPGQGSGTGRGSAAALPRRFPGAADVLHGLAAQDDQVATEVAQPRIVAGSLLGLRVLHRLGITAEAAAGHSLGEITALHWAGAMSESALLHLAGVRGRVMAAAGDGDGAMLGLGADRATAEDLCRGTDAVVAGINAPEQTVVSGPATSIEVVSAEAERAGIRSTRLPVSHAFHSPGVAPAADRLAAELRCSVLTMPERPVLSTVTGTEIRPEHDLTALLTRQVVAPVRFVEAATALAGRSDLLIEVGPGRVLTGLAAEIAPSTPAVAVDTDQPSLGGLLGVVGAAFALGAPVDTDALFAGRLIRPVPLDGAMTFLASPAESAPALGEGLTVSTAGSVDTAGTAAPDVAGTESATEEDTLDVLCRLAAERVELPAAAVRADTRPLDDLHLSSITVGQLVNEACRALGRAPLSEMPSLATAALGDIAEMIDGLAETARTDEPAGEPDGIDDWIRPFVLTHVETGLPAPHRPEREGRAAAWEVHAPAGHPLADELVAALSGAGIGDGVLLCLPRDGGRDLPELSLAAARDVLAGAPGTRFVVVQEGLGASGVARTLRLEDPSKPVTVVDLADVGSGDRSAVTGAVAIVVAEAAATTGYSEVRYTPDGTRTVPRLHAVAVEPGPSPLTGSDVLLVTGGGKGITAECALAMATDAGAALGLLGRSAPESDAELAANLERIRAAGVRATYVRADVTEPASVAAAVERIEAAHGPVTAVLHGAGRNEPAALTNLTPDGFRDALAPKVDGLRAVLDSVDHDRIKLLITFGSIIGRAGLRGEGHYATANDQMTELTRRFGADNPLARAIACEWSVWSGAGMGEKLGVVESLRRDGITPIPADVGIDVLRRLVADPGLPSTVLICGRSGGLETLPMERGPLPLRRFLERTLVHYPGVELIAEADLSESGDPYLTDHDLDGDLLLPAVLGMEAMAQVAGAVVGAETVPTLTDVRFLRPIAVARGGATTIRIAALARNPRTVDVVLRCSDTAFATDHFRARLHYGEPVPADGGTSPSGLPVIPLDIGADLYGGILFQGRRFQRLAAYRRASARHAVAEIAIAPDPVWFAAYLPQERVLSDPGARDAVMHALQCCVPDGTLLPESVDRLYPADPAADSAGHLAVDARERSRVGDSYTYDIDVRDPSGALVERWEGLVLRAVRHRSGAGPWPAALLGSLAERGFERVLGGTRAVWVEPDRANGGGSVEARRAATAIALGRAAGTPVEVVHRPDGRPEIVGARLTASASHSADVTMAVLGPAPVACDVQAVPALGDVDWADLLGTTLSDLAEVVCAETAETAELARTRVWTALECVRKTGSMSSAIVLDGFAEQGWVTFVAGDHRIATWATHIVGHDRPVIVAALGPAAHDDTLGGQ